jgi:hypothetical protein
MAIKPSLFLTCSVLRGKVTSKQRRKTRETQITKGLKETYGKKDDGPLDWSKWAKNTPI